MAKTNPLLQASIPVSRAEEVALGIRESISQGEIAPGQRLAEVQLAEKYQVSRNTLREAFRLLSQQDLVLHVPNRGASVAIPSVTSIIDIYRVRRLVEVQAVAATFPKHPGVEQMRNAVDVAVAASEAGDWIRVGTANFSFHSAIIMLTDSPRLRRLFDQMTAELRLAFGIVGDLEYLHAPFIDKHREIVSLIQKGDTGAAAKMLESYLVQAERLLLAAYDRT